MAPFNPDHGIVLKEPERSGPGYWVGSPSVLYEPDKQRFLLTYRQRRPPKMNPGRGWRCALAASDDGIHFDDIWEIHKAELNTPSMERFSLIPHNNAYRLYISYVDPSDGRWRIDVMEAADPAGFTIESARQVLTATQTGTEGVKDPYVLHIGPVTYMFASFAASKKFTADERQRAHRTGDIYNVGVTTLPTGLATSLDGIAFRWHGPVLDVGKAWDRYQARLGCVVPVGPGYVGFYDGSADVTQNYEEHCGLAVSADLWHWRRITVDQPWIVSPHRTGSTRYVDALIVNDQWWVYYETARSDGAHDLRLHRVT
jgi:hypothetical protein